MEAFTDFLAWAWARHHNPLSWYIRPLFILPFCYFAYRRSVPGMLLTVLALATSMFWFPAPAVADPQIIAFLEAEREWLTTDWTLLKVLLSLTVPAFFILLAWAFWRRSWWVGLAIFNLATAAKVIWSFWAGEASAWSLVPPALIGALAVNGAVILLARWLKRRREVNAAVPALPNRA